MLITVNRKVLNTLAKGIFLVSIDTELAWGGVDDGSYPRRRHLYEGTREIVRRLLQLFEDYEIQATWAVVGHLFLDSCKPVGKVKHPEINRPSTSKPANDWFDDDPCTNWKSDPFWYGPDIVEAILNCRTPQEIGSHGFSHSIVGNHGCTEEWFESELKASIEAAKLWDVELKSFVFPRNSIGYTDLLAANGFATFRGYSDGWERKFPGVLKRAGRGLRNVLPVPPEIRRPELVNGMWNLPSTCLYLHRDGWASKVPIALRVQKARIGLQSAAKNRSIFHLWFHPFNLASDPDGLIDGLESILQEAAKLRGQGILENFTMGETAEQLSAVPQLSL